MSSIKIWNLVQGTEFLELKGNHISADSFDFSPDGNFIVSGNGSDIVIWNLEDGKEI